MGRGVVDGLGKGWGEESGGEDGERGFVGY